MNGPHLDDGTLSAALDDISGTPEDQAHLAACPVCQARLGQLASVSQAVAAAVPARPALEIDAAIERALGDPMPAPAPSEGSAQVEKAAVLRRRSVPRWLGAVGAAAAVAAVIAGVGALLAQGGTGTSHSVAAKAGTGASPAGSAPGPSRGDLGEQSDPRALAALVAARLAGGPAAAPSTGLGSSAAAVPPPGGAAGPSIAGESACDEPARRAAGLASAQPANLRLIAPLRWRGEPALVFVFDRPAPPGGRAGVVMATPGCSLLIRLSL